MYRPSLRHLRVLLVVLVVLVVACAKKRAPAEPPPAPVTVAIAKTESVPVEIRAVGTVEPSSTVSVRSRVSGQLEKVHFTEGQDVNEGDLLFTIDRRPFEAALRRAQASLVSAVAQSKNATSEARRYQALAGEGLVSRQEAEARAAAAATGTANVSGAQAAVTEAKLQLEYCTIRAPIAGRTGNLEIRQGNVVKADDTVLITINTLRPIFVSFAVPESEIEGIRAHMAGDPPAITASPSEEPGRGEGAPPAIPPGAAQGTLTFLDNEVDRTTGTIRLKGTFPNDDDRLWPGRFVQVKMTLATRPDAIVVPSAAVQSGQSGAYVFVVKDDSTVEQRPVRTGSRVGEDRIVVEQGLAAGDKVVVEGQMRLVPGAKVKITGEPLSRLEEVR